MPAFLSKVKTSLTRRVTTLRDTLTISTDSTDSTLEYTTEQPEAALYSLNLMRVEKDLPYLSWDENLELDAECHAQKLARKDKLEFSEEKGECLFVKKGRGKVVIILHDAVKAWFDQEEKYKGGEITEDVLKVARDYTQCMWRSTTHVGMASAKAASGNTYIVGRFSPPGNVIGEKPF